MSPSGRQEPLVAVIYSVPLICEAIASALDAIAQVQGFPGRRGDTVGLLRSVRPDAIVVDDPIELAHVQQWAESEGLPLLEICLPERKVRLHRSGGWEESAGASAVSIRNALAGSLYARDGVKS